MREYIISLLSLGLMLLLGSCSKGAYTDPEPEDYSKLFPFTGIRPAEKNDSDETPVIYGEPKQEIRDYRAQLTSGQLGETEYQVTVRVKYHELDDKGLDVNFGHETSKILVQYYNGSGDLVHVKAARQPEGYDDWDYDDDLVIPVETTTLSTGEKVLTYVPSNNDPFEASFTVRSGYPLYLNVGGVAPRGTRIEASIEAVARDGSVVIPRLSTAQTQNEEGMVRLPQPYSAYIVLP